MAPSSVKRDGVLMTSFQMQGSLHFSMQLAGYPDVGEVNQFLEGLKGRQIRVTIEEIQDGC